MSTKDDAVAALEQAIAAEPSPAPEQEAEKPEPTKDGKGDFIPRTRFNEVNERMKTAETEASQLRGQLQESTASFNKLTEMLNSKQEDSNLVERIRALANDPKAGPHVVALDKILKGVEDEVEEGTKTPEEGYKQTRNLIEKTRTEVADAIADQQAELILSRADQYADRLLENLPQEYTSDDKTILSHLWADQVNWEIIEKDPNNLSTEISESFQRTLNLYGKPRGAYIDPETVEFVDENETVAEVSTPETELKQIVEAKNWGGILKDDKGRISPEVSDADFASEMAKAMKIANRR